AHEDAVLVRAQSLIGSQGREGRKTRLTGPEHLIGVAAGLSRRHGRIEFVARARTLLVQPDAHVDIDDLERVTHVEDLQAGDAGIIAETGTVRYLASLGRAGGESPLPCKHGHILFLLALAVYCLTCYL